MPGNQTYEGAEKLDVLITYLDPKVREAGLNYAHEGDAGCDLRCRLDFDLAPFERTLVPTGISLALPEGYVALVHPRSGLAVKKGITVLNAPGTIDAGYRGEIKVPLINLDSHETVHFDAGDRIAQMVIQRYVQATFVEANALPESQRADRGFGSSGIKG